MLACCLSPPPASLKIQEVLAQAGLQRTSTQDAPCRPAAHLGHRRSHRCRLQQTVARYLGRRPGGRAGMRVCNAACPWCTGASAGRMRGRACAPQCFDASKASDALVALLDGGLNVRGSRWLVPGCGVRPRLQLQCTPRCVALSRAGPQICRLGESSEDTMWRCSLPVAPTLQDWSSRRPRCVSACRTGEASLSPCRATGTDPLTQVKVAERFTAESNLPAQPGKARFVQGAYPPVCLLARALTARLLSDRRRYAPQATS
jgi:hypothetical protein